MQANHQSHDAASAQMGRIMDEYLERANRGERPNIEEYVDRYPDLAEVIRRMLPALEVMQSPDGLDTTGDAPAPNGIQPHGPLGDFHIVRELGRGGMGVVYEANQISLGRTVALKVLPFAAAMDDRQLQRFKNEAQAAACLHHPHIVPVFGVGCERGVHYYAMQMVEGQSLATVIESIRQDRKAHVGAPKAADQDSAPSVSAPSDGNSSTQAMAALSTAHNTNSREYFRSIAKIGQQAAEALEHAHQSGVIHRDVKPANLILDHTGNLWVTDFGLAQMQSDTRLTMTGDLMGTLRYMSPEQALAKRVTVDHRTDIYSLGSTIYELLTLQAAFTGRDREELLRQIAFEEPKSVRRLNHAIPFELETIVMKAMAKNPADRYASSQELADDLQRFLDDKPIHAKRPTLVQHVSRWTRRHRGVAATIMAAMVCAIIGLGIALAVIAKEQRKTNDALQQSNQLVGKLEVEKKRTEEQLQLANEAKAAETAAKQALERLVQLEQESRAREQRAIARERQNSYVHQTTLADVSRREGDYARARSLLAGTRAEFRGWEWDYLTRKVNDAEFVYRGAAYSTEGESRKVYLSPNGEFLCVPVREIVRSEGRVVGQPPPFELTFLSTQTGKPVYAHQQRQGVTGQRMMIGNIVCAFAPDGQRVAVALFDRQVTVLDLREKRELFTLPGHAGEVTCASFSGDGKWLATGSDDKTIRIWDLESHECVLVYEGHSQPVREVAFSPDSSQRIASQAGIWTHNPLRWQLNMPEVEPNRSYLGVGMSLFHPDRGGFRINKVGDNTPANNAGMRVGDIVLKLNDRTADATWTLPEGLADYVAGDEVRIELRRGEDVIQTTVTLGTPPEDVGIGTERAKAVSLAKRADELQIWRADNGKVEVPSVNARTLRWSPNGEYIAYAQWFRNGREITVAKRTGEVVIQDNTLKWARFRPDSQRVLLGGERLEEWNLATGNRLREYPIQSTRARFGDYILGGTHILFANRYINLVEIVNASTGAVVGRRKVTQLDNRGAILLDETGSRFLFETPTSSKVAMWSVHSWMNRVDRAQILSLENVTKVASSRDGRLLALAGSPKYVSLHDGRTGERLHQFHVRGWSTLQLLFNDDNTQLACISDELDQKHHVQIWDLRNFQTVAEQPLASGAFKSAAFHEGQLRTLVVENQKCFVRDAVTQEPLLELKHTFEPPRQRFFRRAMDVNGSLTADGSQAIIRRRLGQSTSRRRGSSPFDDYPVEIWNLATGEHQLVLQGERFTTGGDWVSPQGNYLIISASRGGRKIYDVQAARSYPIDHVGTINIRQYCWSPDESCLLMVAAGKESPLIQASTGRQLLTLTHRQDIGIAAFSESRQLYLTSTNGEVLVRNGTRMADAPFLDPRFLAGLAVTVVMDPAAETGDVLKAVEWAQEARERSKGSYTYYTRVLGAAQYRAGNYRVAVDLLASTLPDSATQKLGYMQTGSHYLDSYWCFLAMAQWKIGDKDAARRSFWQSNLADIDEEPLRRLVEEAAELLGISVQQKLKADRRLQEIVATSGRPRVLPGLDLEFSDETRAESMLLLNDFNSDGTLTENELGSDDWERFRHFDQDDDAAISQNELLAGYRDFGTAAPFSIDRWIARWDKNENGEITADEVRPNVWDHYQQFDANGDAILQRDELKKAYPDRVPERLEVIVDRIYSQFDVNEDDELSELEVPQQLWDRWVVFDSNHDERVDRSELQAGMESLLGRVHQPRNLSDP